MGGKKKAAKEKPLEKMTAKDLRELAKEMPEITGVFGMNKAELIAAIRKARGIEDDSPKKSDTSVREIKQKIKQTRKKQEKARENEDPRMAAIFRRRISRLKKKARRAA